MFALTTGVIVILSITCKIFNYHLTTSPTHVNNDLQGKKKVMPAALQKIGWLVLFIFAWLKLGLLFHFCDKGFDFNDEGFLLNSYCYGEDYKNSIQSFLYPLYKLFKFFPLQIYTFRILQFLAPLVSGCILGIIVLKGINKLNAKSALFVVCIVVAGSGLSMVSRSFFFNEFVFFATSLWVATILCFDLTDTKSGRIRLVVVFTFATAFVLAPVVVVKPPSALLIFLLSIGSITWFLKKWSFNYIGLWVAAVFLFLLLLVYVLLEMFFQNGISTCFAWWKEYYSVINAFGYSPAYILYNAYFKIDFLLFGVFHFLPFVLVLLADIIVTKSIAKERRYNLLFVAGLVALLLISLLYKPVWLSDLRFRVISFYFYLLFFALFIWLKERSNSKLKHHLKLRQIVLMCLIPLVSVAGSNLPLSEALSNYLVPLLLLVAIIFFVYGNSMLLFSFSVVLLAVSTYHYYSFGIEFVERNDVPLYKQAVPFKAPNETIYLDQQRVDFLNSFSKALKKCGVKKGDYVLPIYNMPGECYLVGLKSYGLAWYFEPFGPENPYGAIYYNCYHLLKQHPGKERPYVILLKTKVLQKQLDCLKQSEHHFPQNYLLMDSIWNPIRKDLLMIYKPADAVL